MSDDDGPDKLPDVTMKGMERPDANPYFATMLLVWGAIKDSFYRQASLFFSASSSPADQSLRPCHEHARQTL